ncbi:Phosphopantetheine attachment site [Streptomyces sp. ADI96-02]|uniref:phosphopantetheine-binding protein n=1 Tax=unclassified Streptomyces TaxID=2593676 RepID=UPI000F550168|nr:phosphopantetheine-binding protein [Streptomyces sp. ADI96-02]RPK65807.1 Phosphopantetheine attachment site [Streptomyces sp. ADI96-02]
MTATPAPAPSETAAEPAADAPAAERVTAAIARRVGTGHPLTPTTELAALGIDSLLLLRILGDLAVDPSQEIDPYRLADVRTVADLADFVGDWA